MSDDHGFEDGFLFYDGETTQPWDVYSGQTSLGTLHTDLEESFAYDTDENDITVKSTSVEVKLGSKTSISTKRKGKKVTIKVSAKAWDVRSDSYRAWNAPSAKIQYLSGSTWKTKKTVKLKKGAASYSYKTKSKRTYRFVIGEDATHFGATSSTSRR